MTHAAPSARSYAMRLETGPDGVRVRIERRGPGDPLAIARGRAIADALTLPRLLFPVCPVAHTAAALRAVEAAAGIELSKGQRVARELLVLAEAVTGCIWRSALTWPGLVGAPPVPEPVRDARAACELLAASLYSGNWAQPGGAEMALSRAELGRAHRSLCEAMASLRDSDSRIIEAAREQDLPFAPPVFDPQTQGREETPRSLAQGMRRVRLEDWFIAAQDHGHRRLGDMSALIARVTVGRPQPVPEAISGTGLGQAMTARGRLRHVMTLERGVVTHWQSAAPTDWNFAPDAAAARYAASLADAPGLATRAKWLIAALDPCAPCVLEPVREVAHA